MNFSILFVVLSVFLISDHVKAMSQTTWTYDFVEVNTKSSNPDLISCEFSVERIKRGVFALSGEFVLNIDLIEGDGNELELRTYRSANGDGDYKSIPLEMSRRHFFDALNNHYKDVVMNTFKDCSDLPYFEGEFTPPMEKKTYVMEKCQFSQEGMPNHLEDGVYKIVLSGYGQVEWEVEVVIAVEQNDE